MRGICQGEVSGISRGRVSGSSQGEINDISLADDRYLSGRGEW